MRCYHVVYDYGQWEGQAEHFCPADQTGDWATREFQHGAVSATIYPSAFQH